ncbi:acyl-CoA thioesterase [uncultured Litoreibacter sp.]|uniref:acyl-CoA thioesterase n=1 Tax=uncultured Litoreibacter sp. TaxID=1392394 RepID=UPI00345B5457
MNTDVSYQSLVYPDQIDHNGHMNVQHYVGMFDKASWNYLAAFGFTPKYFSVQSKGFVARTQTVTYHSEVMAGEIVTITTECNSVGKTSIGLSHKMFGIGRDYIAAEMKLHIVQIDTKSRKGAPLPLDKVKAMKRAISGSDANI